METRLGKLMYWTVAALLMPAIGNGAAAAANSLSTKHVLILHSYYKGYRWTDDENRGIQSVLEPELGAANIYVEYMDTKRFWQPEYIRQFPEIYRRKYLDHHFDVILATDNNAFDFLRDYRDPLFPGTPVVFCGVNYFRQEDLAGHHGFTGVSEEADVKETLDLALRLHPGTRHVYVVNEISETGQTVHDEVTRLIPQYAGRIEIKFLERYGMDELRSMLRSLPQDSIVFYSFLLRDGTGKAWEYDEAARAVTSASNAPVYGAWDFNLGLGIIGGKLISGFYQGETAGRLALRVLRGGDPDRIPVVRFSDKPNRYMFDDVQLRRFHIPPAKLPPGSIVENAPETFFSRHRGAATAGGAILFVLIGMNTLLFLNIRRRKLAESALREHQEHLEEQVRERSSELEQAMEALRESQQLLNKTFASLRDAVMILAPDTRIVVDCNPATSKLFGFSRDEIVGRTTRQLHVDEESHRQFGELVLAGSREKGYVHQSFTMMRKNGEIFPTRHSVMPLQAEDGSIGGWVSVIRDVTEEKRAEEKLDQYRRKLKALAAELTAVEARERRSVAAELHENLGQLLATANMKVAAMRSAAPDVLLAGRVAEVQSLVEEALEQTRSLTYQLSPPILYQLGLEAALKWLCESMQKRYGYQVAFTRQGESGSLSEESSVFLFSSVRELLVNVAKHAAASDVVVRLHWMDDQVEVLVWDNGKGFHGNHAQLAESISGFGLFNIQERASDLGGRLWIRSGAHRGMAARIHLPLEQSAGIPGRANSG